MKSLRVSILTGALTALATTGVWADAAKLAQEKGCLGCHAVDKKVVGPAYKDVAAKYKGQADAVATLAKKIKEGGSGNWGSVPMPPNAVSEDEAKTLAEWVLSH